GDHVPDPDRRRRVPRRLARRLALTGAAAVGRGQGEDEGALTRGACEDEHERGRPGCPGRPPSRRSGTGQAPVATFSGSTVVCSRSTRAARSRDMITAPNAIAAATTAM